MTRAIRSKLPSPRRRPRGGRHPATLQAVAASQRARMLDAVALAVADKGYAATTVADVIARAGVSRRTFYEQFADIEACFLAAYEAAVQALLEAVRQAVRACRSRDWRERARTAIQAYLQVLATNPAAAWAYSFEVYGAGRKGIDRHAAVLAHWVRQWRTLQELRQREDRRVPALADDRLLALVGGIEQLVRETLRTRGAAQLPQLTESATAFALSILGP